MKGVDWKLTSLKKLSLKRRDILSETETARSLAVEVSSNNKTGKTSAATITANYFAQGSIEKGSKASNNTSDQAKKIERQATAHSKPTGIGSSLKPFSGKLKEKAKEAGTKKYAIFFSKKGQSFDKKDQGRQIQREV